MYAILYLLFRPHSKYLALSLLFDDVFSRCCCCAHDLEGGSYLEVWASGNFWQDIPWHHMPSLLLVSCHILLHVSLCGEVQLWYCQNLKCQVVRMVSVYFKPLIKQKNVDWTLHIMASPKQRWTYLQNSQLWAVPSQATCKYVKAAKKS